MNTIPKVGVFLCRCGQKIDPFVDLVAVQKTVGKNENVTSCEILPYPCLEPGMETIISAVRKNGVNRVVIAGCESRLMAKKFETRLEPEGLLKGQIDIVNLRGHVAGVSDDSPEKKAAKAAKLIIAAVAELAVLTPTVQHQVTLDHPPMIVGGGIASFTAAQELARQGVDCMMSLPDADPESILETLYQRYPGERNHYGRLRTIMDDVLESSHVSVLPPGKLAGLSGITGDYMVSLSIPGEVNLRGYKAGTLIACLDGELIAPGPEFGYDGETVVCQSDFEESVWRQGIPTGQTIFWISDYETGQPEFAQLSARSAWEMAKHILENSRKAQVVMLYNEQMPLPLTAAERAAARKMGMVLVPYDKAVQPIIQAGYLVFGGTRDHMEHELPWDRIVLSPIRCIGESSMETAKILGIVHEESEFLGIHHAKVRPEMVGREESYLAGSARYACDLTDALNQGRQAGKKNAEMYRQSKAARLYAPRVVCVVDTDKCVGCGQCQELCDCGGIGVFEGSGGGLPRIVDPMVCTGGGTCAAACPYQALTLQNNTNDQREARVAALASQMADTEFVAFACSWAGLPAADNAGNRGMKYDPGIHILGVPCVGQLDPGVMARAFLEGAPGLLMIGCDPESCHHSFGVDHAWCRVNLIKKLFTLCGFDRRRITMAHADLNKPEEFVRTVNSFAASMKALGPMEKTPEALRKLATIYRLVKENSRVRLLLSAGLRRPWEATYRGDQRFALEYDRSDFMAAVKEEYLKTRLEGFVVSEKRPLELEEIAGALSENKRNIVTYLNELISEGAIGRTFKEGQPFYQSAN